MKTILVHACCGPCACAATYEDYCYTFYFNGNNFDSRNEYDKRLFAMKQVSMGVIVELYNPKEFISCEECIRYRLLMCAKTAKEYGFDCFSTTLTISPHKDTALVNRIGKEVEKEVGVPFVEKDLKKNGGYQRSVEISKRMGLYRQTYCGCKRSHPNARPLKGSSPGF